MNTILGAISFIITGIIITIIFGKVRSFIIKKSFPTVKEVGKDIIQQKRWNGKSGAFEDVVNDIPETFQWNKFFKGMLSFNAVELAKDIYGLFNIRKICVYLMIAGVLIGYGYWKGQQGKPINVNLGNEESIEIKVPNSDLRLYKPKNSNNLYWIDKEGNKTFVKVADLPSLQKALKPYGIVFEPYAFTGVGIGQDYTGFEGGVGAHFLKYHLWRLNGALTNRGIYIGVGYKLSGLKMDNTSIILKYGKGWAGDNRVLIGIGIEF